MRWFVMILVALQPAIAWAEGYGFRTPSRNIYCNGSVDGGDITCVIVERNGPPALPQTTPCDGVWGHHYSLNRQGPAFLTCGWQPRPSNYTNVAPYGVTGTFGAITCRSETTGLTCRNQSGHGFFLSRRSQQIF